MFGLICLLIAFLSLGLLGGAIAIILDKNKKEKALQQALGELRQGKMESDRIIASADSIIQEAQKESDRLTDRQSKAMTQKGVESWQ
jgi:hypothetical protein